MKDCDGIRSAAVASIAWTIQVWIFDCIMMFESQMSMMAKGGHADLATVVTVVQWLKVLKRACKPTSAYFVPISWCTRMSTCRIYSIKAAGLDLQIY